MAGEKMTPLTIICWKWKSKAYHTTFTAEHVNTWASMISRNLTLPHRLLCITDDPKGVEIDTVPLWDEFSDFPNNGWNPEYRPQCHRRINVFNPELSHVLGDRFVTSDLDCVVTGSLDEMFSRPEDFVIAGAKVRENNDYVGCMWMMDTGCRPMVYRGYNEKTAKRASRWSGSDQAWIRECLGPYEATWDSEDGLYYFNYGMELPENANIVFFCGRRTPWDAELQKFEWIRENYR